MGKKLNKREKIKNKVRSKLLRNVSRPRLSVFRSNTSIYAQIIDDIKGITLVAFSSAKLEDKTLTKTEQAKQVGFKVAKLALEKGLKACTFDRNGYLYHGRVRAVAEGAREAGILI